MGRVAVEDAKVERIEVRVTAEAKALLTAAARAKHTTVSAFLLTHGIDAAEQVVAMPRVFHVSEEGWNTLDRISDETEQVPNEADLAWIRRGLAMADREPR